MLIDFFTLSHRYLDLGEERGIDNPGDLVLLGSFFSELHHCFFVEDTKIDGVCHIQGQFRDLLL